MLKFSNLKHIISFIILGLVIVAISPSHSSERQEKKAYRKFEKTFSDFAYIPSATWSVPSDSGQKNQFAKDSRKISVQSFYVQKYEVSNAQWMQFVASVEAEKGKEVANTYYPDSNGWNSKAITMNQ